MAVTARTWVEGEIATAAKFNTIRDDILELDLKAGIKTVQYGNINLADQTVTNTATITAVVVAKTVVHNLGCTGILSKVTLTSATVVTGTKDLNGTSTVGFCVAEYK
jgi:hypothetical protein